MMATGEVGDRRGNPRGNGEVAGRDDRMLIRGWPFMAIPVVLLGLGFGWAFYETSTVVGVGLTERVEQQLRAAGAENPVTAVLLNFRAYDTLLEIIVLLLAVIGVGAMGAGEVFADRDTHVARVPANVMLGAMVRLVIPMMVMVAGYVLWRGTTAPGGAFQAGAILGAAGVLWLLGGAAVPWGFRGWRLRVALVAGIAVFLGVGVMVNALGMQFLEFRGQPAKHLILIIEAAATLSMGGVFAALFVGVLPPRRDPGGGKRRASPSSSMETAS